MTIVLSGELRLEPFPEDPSRSIASEFGGSVPHLLESYFRGGGLVPDSPQNANIPTSGTISMENFYGSQAVTVVEVFTSEFIRSNVGGNISRYWGWMTPDYESTPVAIRTGFGAASTGVVYGQTVRAITTATLGVGSNTTQLANFDTFRVGINSHVAEAGVNFSSVSVDFGSNTGQRTLIPEVANPGDAESFRLETGFDVNGAPVTDLYWDLVAASPLFHGWVNGSLINYTFAP